MGTSTPVGDVRELEAVAEVFGEDVPLIGSTKSLSGHAPGRGWCKRVHIYAVDDGIRVRFRLGKHRKPGPRGKRLPDRGRATGRHRPKTGDEQ